MITRPLDLVSRLRAPPRNFDALFYICVIMIGLQFALFGSDYIHARAVPVDFDLGKIATETPDGARFTHRVSITKQGGLITKDGERTEAQFDEWLKREAPKTRDPVLLIVPDSGVTWIQLGRIIGLAEQRGFTTTIGGN